MPAVRALGCQASRLSYQRNNTKGILMVGSLILVLLSTPFLIVLPGIQETNDGDSLPSLELCFICCFARYLFSNTQVLGWRQEFHFTLRKGEYLSAHIGEKRLSDDQIFGLGKLFFALAYSGRHSFTVSSFCSFYSALRSVEHAPYSFCPIRLHRTKR
jgi:hypothetical protein